MGHEEGADHTVGWWEDPLTREETRWAAARRLPPTLDEWAEEFPGSAHENVTGPVSVDMRQARGLTALTVGPDETLVVVFPQFVGMQQLDAHRAHLRRVLGDRFVLLSGNDIQLAKIENRALGEQI